MTFWEFLGYFVLAGLVLSIGIPLLQLIIAAIIALFSNNNR